MIRKKTIGLVAGAFALLLGAGLLATPLGAHLGLSGRVAEASKTLTLDVVADLSTFEAHSQAGISGGPFYVEGAIYPKGSLDGNGALIGTPDSIGVFRCWGWLIDLSDLSAGGVVSQEYLIEGRGKIQVQGLEDERRAVVGGTDDFRKVTGEGFATTFPPTFNFTIDFELKGAKK